MATTIFNFGGVLDQVLANTASTKATIATILTTQGMLMTALTDLQAASTQLTSDVTALTAAVNAAVPLLQQIVAGNSVSAADAENVVSQMKTALAQVESDTSALTGASQPAPAPSQPPSS